MLTIRPLVARSWSRKACVTLNMPSRLIDRMSSQSLATAAASAVIGLRRLMPALLTRIEMLPLLAISAAAALQACAVGHVELHRRRLAAGGRDRGRRSRSRPRGWYRGR